MDSKRDIFSEAEVQQTEAQADRAVRLPEVIPFRDRHCRRGCRGKGWKFAGPNQTKPQLCACALEAFMRANKECLVMVRGRKQTAFHWAKGKAPILPPELVIH